MAHQHFLILSTFANFILFICLLNHVPTSSSTALSKKPPPTTAPPNLKPTTVVVTQYSSQQLSGTGQSVVMPTNNKPPSSSSAGNHLMLKAHVPRPREHRDVSAVERRRARRFRRQQRRNRGFKNWTNAMRMSFKKAGIEDVLKKHQPSKSLSLRSGPSRVVNPSSSGVLIPNRPSKQSSLPVSTLRTRHNGRRIHPRSLEFTRLKELQGTWCQMDKAKIRVRSRGCKPKDIMASFCYGQCTSIYIPQYDSRGRLVKQFRTCGFCQASQWRVQSVRLECPGRAKPFLVKQVSIVQRCSCSDVYK